MISGSPGIFEKTKRYAFYKQWKMLSFLTWNIFVLYRRSSASRSEDSEDQEESNDDIRSKSKESFLISDDSEVEETQANKKKFNYKGNELD